MFLICLQRDLSRSGRLDGLGGALGIDALETKMKADAVKQGLIDFKVQEAIKSDTRAVDISGFELQEFPAALHDIPQLTDLDISRNWLLSGEAGSGSSQPGDGCEVGVVLLFSPDVYEPLSTFTSLEKLNLGTNYLSGDLSPAMGALTDLKSLVISRYDLVTLKPDNLVT